MAGDVFQLDQIQKWMQSVISHPEGVVAGVQSTEAQQQIPVSPDAIAEVVTRSQSLTSLERLQVYGNAYYARLVECLKGEFPAVAHAVGRETFDVLAMGYLQSYPSRSYTLGQLGANFPRFLAEIPLTTLTNQSEEFAAFLIDLATLERLYSEVFDGPGSEDQPPLSPEELQQIPPEAWPGVRLVPVPSLRLASFRFPVHEYITAVHHEGQAIVPVAGETHLAINRREFVVRRLRLDSVPFALLSHLIEGLPLGGAIAQALDDTETDFEKLAASLQTWFQEWATGQFFAWVELPGEE
ncbi:MAG: putative DNA-binding domain-containing protein [Planctomycetaceae bacterium]|nr:putative DNA-binding domain-containing protein [Planctomycetaceae bacterium]